MPLSSALRLLYKGTGLKGCPRGGRRAKALRWESPFVFLQAVRKGGRQTVAALVVGVAVMPLDPNEGHPMPIQLLQKRLPEVGVEGGGAVRFFPALFPPGARPAKRNGVHEVFGTLIVLGFFCHLNLEVVR